ncbi:MAG: alpha/beta hydrolase [Bacteroidetes bacterium]|nr:alpha/beta hydrolase [Bacteroidota bacterium]
MKPKVYIFSGLGTDHRVFKKLNLSAFDATFIHWVKPHPNEAITAYAKRLSAQISEPGAVYIGLSFGGLMAAEVAKQVVPKKLILLASVKTYHEIPHVYRLVGWLRFHKLIPVKWMLTSTRVTRWFFGVKTAEERLLLKEILHDTDPDFLRWAIHTILFWKNDQKFKDTCHIHGNADRILPFRKVKADYRIEGGGHFMTVANPEKIQPLLDELIG